ncbi:helix-turn-helix domain-containing protein [Acinetobacter sp.]|uniref:helix-turn-helix domain-containing protein n=1 Tax=Acinetobacter sp. TaxID=472 RepID=UPI0031D443C3
MKDQEIFITTDSVSSDLRTEFYREIFAPIIDITPLRGDELYGTARIRSVGELVLSKSSYNNQNYNRSDKLVRQSGFDKYLVCLALKGSHRHISYNGRYLSVETGDILIVDLAKSGRGISSAGQHIHAYIPRSFLDTKLSKMKVNQDILLKAHFPMTKILADYMLGLFEVSCDLRLDDTLVTTEAFVALLIVAIKGEENINLSYIYDSASSEILKNRVFDFINHNIRNLDLNVDLLVRRFNVSRAHLYRAFEEEGGIATVIRNKRLELAYQALLNPSKISTVTEIAHEYGFSSSNQFYRAFRQRYGCNPTEIKHIENEIKIYSTIKNDIYLHFKKFINK